MSPAAEFAVCSTSRAVASPVVGLIVSADRPHAPCDVVGEEVAAAIGRHRARAAIDEAAGDRLADRVAVLADRIGQRQ